MPEHTNAPIKTRLAIVGSGAIACGLAAAAAHRGPVLLLARSRSSAGRARDSVEKTLQRLGAEVDPAHVQIVTDPAALAEASFVVEAVIEMLDVKAGRVPAQFMLGKAFFVYWPAGYRPFSKTFDMKYPVPNPGLIPDFGDMRSIH